MIDQNVIEVKESRKCMHCDKVFGKSTETARRHIWDHFVVYACQCGHFTSKCESLYYHQKKNHIGYHTHVRVDKCFFEQAKLEVNASFPSQFPAKVPVKYTIDTPKRRSPVKMVKPPVPKRTLPAATIPKPASPVKPLLSTPVSSPRKSTPVKVPPSPEGPDIEVILAQMTNNPVKSKLSPIKEPRVTLSNVTKAHKRSVTFDMPTPSPKKAKKSLNQIVIKDIRYEMNQLRRDYRSIENLQQMVTEAKNSADNRLNRIEEMLQHLERESVEVNSK
jgi:hypothetical protein